MREMAMAVKESAHAFLSWGYLTSDEAAVILKSDIQSDARSCVQSSHEDYMRRAIAQFKQRWAKYGLVPNDELDEQTAALMGRRFCNCSDMPEQVQAMSGSTRQRKWDSNGLTWSGTVQVGNLSWSEAQTFTRNETAKVCGMSLHMIGQGGGHANLRSYDTHIDGPGGTLAQAYLPGYPSRANRDQLTQEFDRVERFSQHAFNMTTLHEIGHSLGLSHDTSQRIAVMDPFLNEDLMEWQQPDVHELVSRYGPSSDVPTQPPIPEPEPEPPEEPDDSICPRGFSSRDRKTILRSLLKLIREIT